MAFRQQASKSRGTCLLNDRGGSGTVNRGLMRFRVASPDSRRISLRSAGLRAIYDGLTSVEEVLRETFHT